MKYTMDVGSLIGHQYDSKERTDDVTSKQSVTFDELLLSDNVQRGLKSSGFLTPSPIQLKAIPLGRCGLDMVVQAKSGTGKTCVFSVIALESVDSQSSSLQAIVLAPTREIALQIHSVILGIGRHIPGLNIEVFIGGTEVSKDRVKAKKCHIAIGSPGRIKQLIELEVLLVKNVRLFVLDEADKLVEEGTFQNQINWIYSSLPASKQMLAVSATYPEVLAQFLKCYMCQPQFVRLNPTDPSLIGLKQYYYVVGEECLPYIMFERKTQSIIELLSTSSFQQALVFSNFHTRAHSLSEILNSAGWPSAYISGNLQQSHRIEAINRLKEFKCRVLISTDLTSRGIDAYNVDLVINMDIPLDWETYMHRIGRAGRFGSRGTAVTLVGSMREKQDLLEIAACSNALITKLDDLSAVQCKPDLSAINQMERKVEELHVTSPLPARPVPTTDTSQLTEILQINGHNRDIQEEIESSDSDYSPSSTSQSSDITAEEQSQPNLELPCIPSIGELLQSSSHLRQNVHLRSMSAAELQADLAFFLEHGKFAPPPERLRHSHTGDGPAIMPPIVHNGSASSGKGDHIAPRLKKADANAKVFDSRVQERESETAVNHHTDFPKAKINGVMETKGVISVDRQNNDFEMTAKRHRSTTPVLGDKSYNARAQTSQNRMESESRRKPPGKQHIRPNINVNESKNGLETVISEKKGSVSAHQLTENDEHVRKLQEECVSRQNATKPAAYVNVTSNKNSGKTFHSGVRESSVVCPQCHDVSPWILYEDDREFADFVYRRAVWYAHQYVQLT